ncbi:MAG: D-alanyl-D-alanine carboxypeptidase [Caldimonas sp.]
MTRHWIRVLGAVGVAGALAIGLAVPQSGIAASHARATKPKRAAAPSPRVTAPASLLTVDDMPLAVDAILRRSGLPRSAFAIDVRPVDRDDAPPLIALNADRPYLLASTTKLVTTMAALDLLGPDHHWVTIAQTTGPLKDGRIAGDLVLTGGPVGLTLGELSRWFAKMRAQGVRSVAGNIVLDDFTLLHEHDPKQVSTTEAESEAPPLPVAPSVGARVYNKANLLVVVKPAEGPRAAVTVTPRPENALVVNDVFMGDGGCSAWARWKTPDEIDSGPPLQLWVRGRWKASCPGGSIGWVAPPPDLQLADAGPAKAKAKKPVKAAAAAAATTAIASTRIVADLWAKSGGGLGGRVVELDQKAPRPHFMGWTSELSTPLAEVVREMNKTSNNEAARSIMLSFAQGWTVPVSMIHRRPLDIAQERVRRWLRDKGLADGDITVDVGSGQSRAERGKPEALVALLRAAWRNASLPTLLESLPIAGVDGTLAHRMTAGPARGLAHLKTGTLSDTRALAGYVRARSGKVYAVSLIVTNPAAAGATRSLDEVVEWIASAG